MAAAGAPLRAGGGGTTVTVVARVLEPWAGSCTVTLIVRAVSVSAAVGSSVVEK